MRGSLESAGEDRGKGPVGCRLFTFWAHHARLAPGLDLERACGKKKNQPSGTTARATGVCAYVYVYVYV
jgi:hypothetical protein